MGPEYICLLMARYILENHPNIAVNEIDLGYAIQDYIDAHFEEMIGGEESCNQFARGIIERFPSIMDDEALLGATIMDFVDKIKVGDEEGE